MNMTKEESDKQALKRYLALKEELEKEYLI